MHLLRVQGGSVLHRNGSVDEIEQKRMWSVVHPYVTESGETASYLNPGNNWQGLVGLAQAFIKLWGVLQGMVPADFELDPRAVQSGFAKIIESLPKIEARAKLETYAMKQEKREWTRRRNVYLTHGLITSARAGREDLVLHTEFEGRVIPKSPDETIKLLEFDLKNHLTTPAGILSSRLNITNEEAQQKIDENKQANGGNEQAIGGLAALIEATGQDDDNEEAEDNLPDDKDDDTEE